LGEVIGTGGNIFDNITLRAITDEEIAEFDNTHSGVDFGWFPHPWVYERTHLDLTRRRLFVFDEDTALRLKNADAAERILEHLTIRVTESQRLAAPFNGSETYVLDETVMCDSAEMKSIADYRDAGLDARPVRKGQGSVNYGLKWLSSLVEIVIDPVRCPLAAEQFPTYEFERTKDGAYTSNAPDVDDDSIDAVRYSVNDAINRRE
jgi:phage terminase large subunit